MTKRKTLKARSPEDLLAVVPIVLGFHPEDSIVMLTFGPPGETFHARVDLPGPDQVPDAVAPLLQAAVRNRVDRVAFILYTREAALGWSAAAILTSEFGGAGLDVVAVLRADGRRWFRLDGPDAPEGRPYDVGSHPFAAQAVYDGTVTHRDRASLAKSLEPLPAAVANVVEVMPAALARLPDLERAAEAAWIVETVFEVVEGERRLSDADVARLVVAITDIKLRDAAWLQMQRHTARRHSPCGPTCCAGPPRSWWPRPPACWRSLPGSRVRARWPGARSTDVERPSPTTAWPSASRWRSTRPSPRVIGTSSGRSVPPAPILPEPDLAAALRNSPG